MQIPITGGMYQDASIGYDLQRCVNLYPEYAITDPKTGASTSKNISKLVATPGMLLEYTVIADSPYPIRWMHVCQIQNKLVVVCGNQAFLIDSTGTITTASGTMGTTTGVLSIADNGFQVAITDGNAYYFNINDAAPTITALGVAATKVLFNDTYLIFITPSSPVFFISGNDNVSLDAADFASIQNYPQNINGAEICNGYLLLPGTQVTEVWQDSGDALFPYSKIPGVVIETGCAAFFTFIKILNFCCWLGTNEHGGRIVYKSNGFGYERISTHAIEFQISSYTITDAYAFSYQERGHFFYVLVFPSNNATWVYDATTTLWHERAYFDPITNEQQCWLASCQCFFNGMNLVGDRRNGKIYSLDFNTYKDDGVSIRRIRTTPHYAELDNYQNVIWNFIILDMETGTGTEVGQGSVPILTLDISNDGGYTWYISRQIMLPQTGQYRKRIKIRRLGKSRSRVYRLTLSDPIPLSIYGCSTSEKIANY